MGITMRALLRRQGGVSDEAAAKRPYLVGVDSVAYIAGICIPDPVVSLRNWLLIRKQEVISFALSKAS